MSQVVFPTDVGDLLGLHGLQLGTVGNTMAETTAERAAPLPWEDTAAGRVRIKPLMPHGGVRRHGFRNVTTK